MTFVFLSVLCSSAFALWLDEDICPQIQSQWPPIQKIRYALRSLAILGGLWMIGVGVMAGVG